MTRQIDVGQVEAHERRVRVVDRRVDDHLAELVADRAQELADRLAGGRLGRRVGGAPKRPQVIADLDADRRGPGRGRALAQLHEVRDAVAGSVAEVREDVTHVEVEVDHGRVLAGDLRDRAGQVGRQERLAGPALGREHRDDPALWRLGPLPACRR